MFTSACLQTADVATLVGATKDQDRHWLAGDHHVHSQYSVGWEADSHEPSAPPKPVIGGDGLYPIGKNALMAQKFGLAWMVSTDHGGPGHSKINRDQAYPELLESRLAIPGLIQFYGMEFDTPGGVHSSLIIPYSKTERQALFEIESRFASHEAWPIDPSWDTEARMVDVLKFAATTAAPPIFIVNHPSRSAPSQGVYGRDRPDKLRAWNDIAPQIAIGMEGSPGHQAASLNPDASSKSSGRRGLYEKVPTLGGFDPMTAKLGGFWDSMLGEGRAWHITSTSDSHRHFTEGGRDFWPGEYAKTYVFSRFDPADIVDGLRQGRVFVTTGDLISELDLTVTSGRGSAAMGESLDASEGRTVTVHVRVRDPSGPNAAGRKPDLARIDLIEGDVKGPVQDPSTDVNPSTKVVKRFTASDWHRDGEVLTMRYSFKMAERSVYFRLRGTNTDQLEPLPDPAGEDPWSDLWFYSNPVFVRSNRHTAGH